MKIRFIQVSILSFLLTTASFAIDPIGKIEKVANKIIANTSFEFQLELSKPNTYFDFIEVVDFGRTYGENEPGVAFSYTEIHSEAAKDLEIQVSHNDGLIILMNGKEVYRKTGKRKVKLIKGERALEFESKFNISLKQGKNTLILKSNTDGDGKWIVYLQPSGSLIFDESSNEGKPKIGLGSNPLITDQVSKLSNWLVVGKFETNFENSLAKAYGPEKGLEPGTIYKENVTWELPRIEVLGNVQNGHPMWGSYYNYNYHTGGVAWAMMHLSEVTGNNKYDDFAKHYTDFHINTKPFIRYQVKELNAFRSVNNQLIETPLLDFTLAPSLPYIYRIVKGNDFENKTEYETWINQMTDYALNEQLRSGQGHYWRYTPVQYTTWADDMFMGLPYLMLAAELETDANKKAKIYDDVTNQYFAFNEQVWNKDKQLYQHAQYSGNKVKMPHWTRANGWAIWATTEILLRLPKHHPAYNKIKNHFQAHVNSIVEYQNEKGFWYNVIDEPESKDETSGTAILTLALARGVNNGWLKDNKYRKYAIKGWEALESVIEDDGTVHGICMGTMCSEDLNYYLNRPILDDDSHGILGLIFAAIEIDRLMDR